MAKPTLIRIYGDQRAEIAAERAGKPYQPCNGTEGLVFTDAWCGNCARDKAMSEGKPIEECNDNEKCEIIANSMCYSVGDPQYPKEWVFAHDGQPCCTAFVEKGEPIPLPKDEATADMFAALNEGKETK